MDILNRLAAGIKGGLAARLIAAVPFYAALEGVIFHSGLYARIVEPDSTTGRMELQLQKRMELQLQNEIRRPKPDRNQVLAVGHSRVAFMPKIANQMQDSGLAGGLASITLVLAVFEEKMGWFEKIAVGPAWVYGAACAVLLLSVELMGFAGPAVPFVYFQF